MRPTEILSEEHRVIEVVLQVLGAIAEEAERHGKVNRESAEQAIDFIRTFADQCHHGKEEQQLFKAMTGHGLPGDSGPIAAMLHDHEQGRGYVAMMADSLEGDEAGDPEAVGRFCDNARGYIALLQTHIQKEDRVLFPMADRLIDAEAEERLMSAFRTVEHDHMGSGAHERYLQIARDLARKYGIPHDTLNTASCGCGHD